MMQPNTEDFTMGRVAASRRGAFTLVELLIVAGLLASLAAFSWPSVRRSLARAERQRAVESVRALLDDARSRALTRGRPHVLRFDDRSAEMELFEVRFDEADADRFQSDARQATAARLAAPPRVRNAAPQFDAKSPQTVSGVAVDTSDLHGPELRLVESRELPASFRCRAPQALFGALPTKAFAAENHANRLDANGAAGVADHVVRLVYDVAGRTADARLELCGPDGLCTPLLVAGRLGKVTTGAPHKRVAASTDQSAAEVTR